MLVLESVNRILRYVQRKEERKKRRLLSVNKYIK